MLHGASPPTLSEQPSPYHKDTKVRKETTKDRGEKVALSEVTPAALNATPETRRGSKKLVKRKSDRECMVM